LSKHSIPKKKLRGVIAGAVSSFICRNNDMWGYWGIGVLCLEALKAEVSSVDIDILKQRASFPQAHDPHNAEVMYTRLIHHLTTLNIAVDLISKLSISVQFIPLENDQVDHTEADLTQKRYQARCVGTLVDHFGNHYQKEQVIDCLPHNSLRELRSLRFNTYRRFLIIGATGYTGQAVVRLLRENDIHTVAHIRPDSPRREEITETLSSLGVVVDTSSWSEAALSKMLLRHKPTHIFSLLGTTKSRAKSAAQKGGSATYQDIDRDLSLLLLKSIEEANTQRSEPQIQPKYTFLSSMGVTQKTKNPYLRARADVERQVKASAIPWIIVQPSFISGADRSDFRPLERFGFVVCDGLLSSMKLLGIKKPHQLYGTLNADQLAQGLIGSALDESIVNQTLNIFEIRRWISS
jgi:hypothetical protein